MSKKVVQYLFPDEKESSNIKVFQEDGTNIVGFYFSRDHISEIKKLENSSNYSIYFLINESELDKTQIYIGQSRNGVNRITEHNNSKTFWSYAIMFVTDNNSFDALDIDYFEYFFINKVVKDGSYTLMNKDKRVNEPVTNQYNIVKINKAIKQIEFLLETINISFSTSKENNNRNLRIYKAKGSFNGSIYVKSGKFYLIASSEIKRPTESSKDWKNSHYESNNSLIDSLISEGKVKDELGKLITQVDLEFKSPSSISNLLTGYATNGWEFFPGLDELRK